MSLLDWLFSRKLSPETPQSEKRRTQSTPLREPERPVRIYPSEKRPFDTIADAQAAWQAIDFARAEKLFKKGIDAYKHSEPDGVDFALGRYGAFLLDQDRVDEAMHVLEQAIERKTDIPAIWSDYMRIMSDRRDIDAFKRAAGLMAGAMKHHVEPEFMLAHARRADREGASVFAEAVARWVVDTAANDGDKRGRWAAVGDLGHILERAGRLDEAVILWQGAFDEGSDDPDTASRLSMQLERNKDFATATAVIREALTRGLPASVEESLRKRLARCESKTAGNVPSKAGKPEVAAYSIRRGPTLFKPIFQTRLKPPIKDLELIGNVARCLLTAKDSSTLVDIDLGMVQSSAGSTTCLYWAIRGSLRTVEASVSAARQQWKGPTLLKFIDAKGRVSAESSVPTPHQKSPWGRMFGTSVAETVSSTDSDLMEGSAGPGKHPVPGTTMRTHTFDRVRIMWRRAIVCSCREHGARLCRRTERQHSVARALPNERQTCWEFTIPLHGGRGNGEPYAVLGLPLNASRDQVKSAYRRLAIATHPDRNPGDNAATDRFRSKHVNWFRYGAERSVTYCWWSWRCGPA